MTLCNRCWLSELQIKDFTLELLRLVQIKEIGLALSFGVDSYQGASQRLKENSHWFYHCCNRDLLDRLCFLLVQFDIIKSDKVVCRYDKVEVVSNHKRHGLYTCSLWELEADFFSLALLQEKKRHLDRANLHSKAGARRVHCSS